MFYDVFIRRTLVVFLTLMIISPTAIAEDEELPSRRETIGCALSFGLLVTAAGLGVKSVYELIEEENKKTKAEKNRLVRQFDNQSLAMIIEKILDTESTPKLTKVYLFDNIVQIVNSDVSLSIDDTNKLLDIINRVLPKYITTKEETKTEKKGKISITIGATREKGEGYPRLSIRAISILKAIYAKNENDKNIENQIFEILLKSLVIEQDDFFDEWSYHKAPVTQKSSELIIEILKKSSDDIKISDVNLTLEARMNFVNQLDDVQQLQKLAAYMEKL